MNANITRRFHINYVVYLFSKDISCYTYVLIAFKMTRSLNSYCIDVIVRGAFGKYVARSFFSVTDKQTHSCMVSF